MGAVLVLAGCGSGNKKVSSTIAPGSPTWVTQGTGAFKDGFYGVGSVTGVKDKSLAVSTANFRARAEIATIVKTYVALLEKSFQESTGDIKNSSSEQDVSRVMKGFTQVSLSGVMPVDHWVDPSDGTMYSLDKLDRGALNTYLDADKGLDAKVRDYVKANSEKAYDELAAQEAKQ